MNKLYHTGRILNISGDLSVRVRVDKWYTDKKYNKRSKIFTNYICHNPQNKYVVGDFVQIRQVRPISKKKHHIVWKKLNI